MREPIPSNSPEAERLKKCVNDLREFYDSVQIFATRVDEDSRETAAITHGVGNWYARMGQVREWLSKEDELARAAVRKTDNSE